MRKRTVKLWRLDEDDRKLHAGTNRGGRESRGQLERMRFFGAEPGRHQERPGGAAGARRALW